MWYHVNYLTYQKSYLVTRRVTLLVKSEFIAVNLRIFLHTRCKRSFLCEVRFNRHIRSDWTLKTQKTGILKFYEFLKFPKFRSIWGEKDNSSLREVRFDPRELTFTSHLSHFSILDVSRYYNVIGVKSTSQTLLPLMEVISHQYSRRGFMDISLST